MTIKSLSPVTRAKVQGLYDYIASSFPEASLDGGFESVETDAVFIGVDRREKGWLHVGVSGPAMRGEGGEHLVQAAQSLGLVEALLRAPQGQRFWLDLDPSGACVLRLTNKDIHSPDPGKPIPRRQAPGSEGMGE